MEYNKSSKEELEEFLKQFFADTNEVLHQLWFDECPLNKLESLDSQVTGDNHPEIFALIMSTYKNVEAEKRSK